MKWYLICFVLIQCSLAMGYGIDFNGSRAVYVDFKSAEYEITYDIKKEKAFAKSKIEFYQFEGGHPIFDLVPVGYNATIDGISSEVLRVVSPTKDTSYKTLEMKVEKGYHTLIVTNEISENIDFSEGGVQSGFWMSDLRDREFLEQYMPTNLEYDSYKASFKVRFIGNKTDQTFYTNGTLKKLDENTYEINFPEYFRTSSFYFHTATINRFFGQRYTLKSINGKTIPVYIYSCCSQNVYNAWNMTEKTFHELERDFGAWPHPMLLIYVAGRGGMEFCGATITSLRAVSHEITHSYFGRGMMPFNGNAGWIDEALTIWSGQGYPQNRVPNYTWSNMGNHSIYRRHTDRAAYTKGASFMSYVNHQLQSKGGLKKFIRNFYSKHLFDTYSNETLRKELESFSDLSFQWDFNNYVYGSQRLNIPLKSEEFVEENPYHPRLSKEELKELL